MTKSANELKPLDSYLQAWEQTVEQRWQGKQDDTVLPTGWHHLDAEVVGLRNGELTIIAGRPGMGKTSFAVCLLRQVASRLGAEGENDAVALFSLEMSHDQLYNNLVSQQSGIPISDLFRDYSTLPQVFKQKQTQLKKALDDLGALKLHFHIDTTSSLSTDDMRERLHKLSTFHRPRLIALDYLQLLETTKGMKRVDAVGENTRALKAIAKDFDCPVVVLSQLSRAVENDQTNPEKIPELHHLRDSGCLAGSTQVLLPTLGTCHAIKELVGKSDFNVLSLNTETWRLEEQPVEKVFETGMKEVYRLTFKSGRYIDATANHKFRTLTDWVNLEHIGPGDRLAVPRIMPNSIINPTMTYSEVALLAHMIGDGCCLYRRTPSYTKGDYDLCAITADLALDVFGDKLRPYVKADHNHYITFFPASFHVTHNKHNPMIDWMVGLGLWNKRGPEKFIPERVMQQPNTLVAEFLAHLWAGDGCILHGKQPRIYYTAASEMLSRQVQSLLTRLGIISTLHQVPQGSKGLDQWTVVVSGLVEQVKFLLGIGTVGDTDNQHAALILDHHKTREANTNQDTIPQVVWQQHIHPTRKERGLSCRDLAETMGKKYNGTSVEKVSISRPRLDSYAEALESDTLSALANSDVYWDTVKSIEYRGVEPVYDMTVANLHNFVANDIIVHNSIEQDADNVWFVYRPGYYRSLEIPKEEDGVAYIIIGKFRQGAARKKVPFLWQGEYTRFDPVSLQTYDKLRKKGRLEY
jgi:replicative DNA helicase